MVCGPGVSEVPGGGKTRDLRWQDLSAVVQRQNISPPPLFSPIIPVPLGGSIEDSTVARAKNLSGDAISIKACIRGVSYVEHTKCLGPLHLKRVKRE